MLILQNLLFFFVHMLLLVKFKFVLFLPFVLYTVFLYLYLWDRAPLNSAVSWGDFPAKINIIYLSSYHHAVSYISLRFDHCMSGYHGCRRQWLWEVYFVNCISNLSPNRTLQLTTLRTAVSNSLMLLWWFSPRGYYIYNQGNHSVVKTKPESADTDADACDAWFHFQCVHIKRAPDSDWFFSTCA